MRERRFLEEMQALTRLVDRRTARVLDFGRSAEGPLFTATEWVEGSSLKEVLAAAGRLAPRCPTPPSLSPAKAGRCALPSALGWA